MVSSVTKDAVGLVTVMDDQRHNLVTGDVVTFNSIQGMTEVRTYLVCPCSIVLAPLHDDGYFVSVIVVAPLFF